MSKVSSNYVLETLDPEENIDFLFIVGYETEAETLLKMLLDIGFCAEVEHELGLLLMLHHGKKRTIQEVFAAAALVTDQLGLFPAYYGSCANHDDQRNFYFNHEAVGKLSCHLCGRRIGYSATRSANTFVASNPYFVELRRRMASIFGVATDHD